MTIDLDEARRLAARLLEVLTVDDAGSAPRLAAGPLAIGLIQHFESCRLQAYLDAAGVWTIGWGETGPHIKQGLVWSQAKADESFAARLGEFEAAVRARVDHARTLPREFGAMVSLAYNIGAGAFAESTLLKLHNAGDKAGAAEQFPRWNRAGGKVLNGLTRRRAAERALYLGNFEEVPR